MNRYIFYEEYEYILIFPYLSGDYSVLF